MLWFKTYRNTLPLPNPRLNTLIVDISNPVLKNFKSTADCVIDAVHSITSANSGPYTLLSSGGVDSQAMIYAWHLSKIPFKVVHYTYNGHNDHDTDTLRQYAKQIKFDFEIKNFDALGFIQSSELIEYAKKYDCSSPQLLTYVKLLENHSETVIMGGNTFDGATIGLNYTILVLDRFSQIKKENLVPFFFSSTPSITYLRNYVSDVTSIDWIEEYKSKIQLYDSFGASVIPQPPYGFTGFEKIKEMCDIYPVPIKLRYKYKDKPSKRFFDIAYRYELYRYIGAYSEDTRTIAFKEEK